MSADAPIQGPMLTEAAVFAETPSQRPRRAVAKESAGDYVWTDPYCLCRGRVTTGDMIACDTCPNWFHFECLGIDSSVATRLHQYVCRACLGRVNPGHGFVRMYTAESEDTEHIVLRSRGKARFYD